MRKSTPDKAHAAVQRNFKTQKSLTFEEVQESRRKQLDGLEAPNFKVIRYEEEVIHDGSGVLIPVIISGGISGNFQGCPNCFDLVDGGGILIECICSNCGFVLPFDSGRFFKEKKKERAPGEPERLNWNKQKYDGQSLYEIALSMRTKERGLQEIADVLTKLTGQKIRPQNVSSHVGTHVKKSIITRPKLRRTKVNKT